MGRRSEIERVTSETQVSVALDLDERSGVKVETGIGFFDHMLNALARHGGLGLSLTCKGDLWIDAHHSMEDTGLALGQALREALGDKRGISRFGFFYAPLDESLARTVIDLSGRPHLSWRCAFPEAEAGGVSVRLHHEFFQALANAAGMTLHVDLLACEESHHGLEAIYKSFGRALRQAVSLTGAAGEIPSTKGTLA
ncbi:MAG: imidazoleglycerol-phosphate dehydratase HisB [Oligosphaeraceae bacterium]